MVNPRVIGEEIVGAEIVAGKELTEAAGGLFEVCEQTGTLWLQQGRWMAEDYGRFWLDVVRRPFDPTPLNRLLNARAEHLANGAHQFFGLLQQESVPLANLAGMWNDFLGTIARDWRSR